MPHTENKNLREVFKEDYIRKRGGNHTINTGSQTTDTFQLKFYPNGEGNITGYLQNIYCRIRTVTAQLEQMLQHIYPMRL